jgi:hypothetical protein
MSKFLFPLVISNIFILSENWFIDKKINDVGRKIGRVKPFLV